MSRLPEISTTTAIIVTITDNIQMIFYLISLSYLLRYTLHSEPIFSQKHPHSAPNDPLTLNPSSFCDCFLQTSAGLNICGPSKIHMLKL